MKSFQKVYFWQVVTAISVAVVVLLFAFILVQSQQSSRRTEKLSEEIKEQTDINQRFFRCLVLIPPNAASTPEERVKLVDKCATESRVSPTTSQTPPSDIQNQSNNSTVMPRTSTPVAPIPPSSMPPQPQAASASQSQTAPSTFVQPTAQPSLIDQVSRPITNLIERL
jgi:hypothetical protein